MSNNINYQTNRRLSRQRPGEFFKPRRPRTHRFIELFILLLSIILFSYFIALAYEII